MTVQERPNPNTTASVSNHPYVLTSITQAASPVESDDRIWHRYVITQGVNQIVGHRPGTAETVRIAAEQLVGKLNDRRAVRTG